ncbi:hypothetical protein N7520_005223 [Penicillium odoratum]|uniref:uncharacterized protein n=1 Tax=Penicillium odoratum TaxID=1167516 RepID=UPI002548EAFD|nr:uncharacterized protein N7520_005223 [Penicillium odoratum]KAJ5765664.1 hypothetical protein N7520_005223 [Penicillium odoratum]
MALLSRPSLRSVRRNPNHLGNDGRPPPMKKQRTLEEYGLRRRRSSPDCLDTTTTQESHPVGKVRSANPPLSATRPRTATTRARGHSSASADSIASNQLKTPGRHINGNRSSGSPRVPDRNTPAIHHLHDDRESPDPLDTISPAPTTIRPRSRASVHAPEFEKPKSPATTRSTRHNNEPLEPVHTIKQEESEAQPAPTSPVVETRSQPTRRSELDLLENELVPAPTGTERRSLRSADTGSRKSELAQYFYNYEQIISLDQSKPETLAANTNVTLIDDLSEPLPFPSTPDPMPFGNPLQKLYNCEVISLPIPVSQPEDDPLCEELYFRSHRRFERQEKQLRNIERDRAQHEKQQVDRLLEELRGQDWLRVMGLTGVHESEKKLYEPKREILIQELVALVNKFQVWKDEERRRKLAKEKSHPSTDEAESRRSRKRSRPAEEAEESSLSPGVPPSTPDPNDVDAWAARQLHQEARSASDSAAKNRKSISGSRKLKPADEDDRHPTDKSSTKRPKAHDPTFSSPPTDPVPFFLPPPDDKPFTSFFSDPDERETALSAMPGNFEERTTPVLAFGHPIPRVGDWEFQPPEDLLTEEALQASQRQRRLLKRRSHG